VSLECRKRYIWYIGDTIGLRVTPQGSPVDWAIELLRDGSNLREHESRFEPGGKYCTMPMGSFAVLDFRRQAATQLRRRSSPNTYFVLFSADYGQATLHHAMSGLQWPMNLSE